ncbi:MAG TPA: ABC transporter substrate-binding protein [Beijerinckiaceae bacterium]|jgi:branched-chain amino acid transport system substrate-binding protein
MKTATLSLALAASLLAGTAFAENFVIGSHVPLTGNLARVGKGMDEGIAVAVSLANEDHKGRHTFEVRKIDDETSPAKAVAAVERLASEGVVAFTGGYGSNIIGPASEAADKAGKVYITSGGVSPGLTKRGLKTFFRINNEDGYGRAMVGLFKSMGVKKVSVLYLNKEATSSIARSVEKDLKEIGVEVASQEFDDSTKDFKPIINRVKLRDRSDAVAMIGYENDYVGILRAAAVLKPDVKAMVGVWSLATSQMNGEFNDLMQNVYGTALLPYPVTFSGPEAVRFGEAYKKLHGKEPDYLGQFGYVQTKLLIEAMVRASDKGTLKSGGLAEELRATKSETLIGPVTFDAGGDNTNFSHRMGQHQGKTVQIVWPENGATGKMNFPAVSW